MPLYLSAYDTLACHGFVTSKIHTALEENLIMGTLHPHEGASRLFLVQNSVNASQLATIPTFVHPFLIERDTAMSRHTESNPDRFVAVDVRGLGRLDPHQNTFIIKARSDYDFQVLRGKFNAYWVDQPPSVLGSLSHLPLKLYGLWMSQSIGRRFFLDTKEQMDLQILVSLFYVSLFHGEHDHWDTDRAGAQIQKATGLNAQFIFKILDQLGKRPIADIDELCTLMPEITESVRLKGFNRGILYALLKSSWYGSNASETVAVACEHIPTWLAMVYSAAQERSFHNTGVAKLIEVWDRKDKGMSFVRAAASTLASA